MGSLRKIVIRTEEPTNPKQPQNPNVYQMRLASTYLWFTDIDFSKAKNEQIKEISESHGKIDAGISLKNRKKTA